jgi:hypothetical protein
LHTGGFTAADDMSTRRMGAAGEASLLLGVPKGADRFAIESTDSGPFVGHDPREARRLWDVTFLSSDASKLA